MDHRDTHKCPHNTKTWHTSAHIIPKHDPQHLSAHTIPTRGPHSLSSAQIIRICDTDTQCQHTTMQLPHTPQQWYTELIVPLSLICTYLLGTGLSTSPSVKRLLGSRSKHPYLLVPWQQRAHQLTYRHPGQMAHYNNKVLHVYRQYFMVRTQMGK